MQREPLVDLDLLEYAEAYQILSGSRPEAFDGINCIPLSEICAYCQLYDVDDIETFVYLIRRMDRAYTEQILKRKKTKQKQTPRGNSPRRHR